jgi:hypothetical protein
MNRAILLLPLCACMACHDDTFVFHHTRKLNTTSVYDITRANRSYWSVILEIYVMVHNTLVPSVLRRRGVWQKGLTFRRKLLSSLQFK